MKRLTLATAILLAACVSPHAPPTHQHSFADAEKWARVFDEPERDAWQKPHEVIQALGLKPDAAVADIGAGTGYFAVRLAHLVPKGKVYAVDVEPGMVDYLEKRAQREQLPNLLALEGEPGDPRLPARVDLVLIVDTVHHIEERERYFEKLKSALKPGGRVAIIDFRIEAKQGPPRHSRIAPERVKSELAAAGYALAQEHGFLPQQYFLVFTARD
jgi:ubiquinone/menaquinone biosynthesis C-methylase UbiE